MLENTILADWKAWYGRHDCGVNRFAGGDVFVCHRPRSPHGNGSFCEYHGQTVAADLELTWNARFRSVLTLPETLWQQFYTGWLDFKVEWRQFESAMPTCTVKACGRQSIYKYTDEEDGDTRWQCQEHLGP